MLAAIFTCLFFVLLPEVAQGEDITSLLEARYENKMISSGPNRPAIRLSRDNLADILVLLHHGVGVAEIRSHFEWSKQELQSRLDLLLENDFVALDENGRHRSNTMVITTSDSERLTEIAQVVARAAAKALTPRIPEVKTRVAKLAPFKHIDFKNSSLLVLSDVMLDNWQINSIEAQFLGKDRTARHGHNYYHSLQQKSTDKGVESFGIYGNQMWSADNHMVGVYGNTRLTSRHFLSLDAVEYAQLFGLERTHDLSQMRGDLLARIVDFAGGSAAALDAATREGLRELGILNGNALQIPILTSSDYEDLKELATLWTEPLVTVLEEHRPLLSAAYSESSYVREISLEEYLIWWYHFFYSELTDIFVEAGHIQIPAAGVATYIVDWSED